MDSQQTGTLIIYVCWIVGGGIVFGLYYLLYKKTLKKNGTIQSSSFIIKAPLIIRRINIVAWVSVPPFMLLSILIQHISDTPILMFIAEIVIIPIGVYIILSVALSIGYIFISFVFYKKQLITKDRLLSIVLINSIYIIIMFIIPYLMYFRQLLYIT